MTGKRTPTELVRHPDGSTTIQAVDPNPPSPGPMAAGVWRNTWRPDGVYSVSCDRRRRGDGLTRIVDESRNAYLTDEAGAVLAFVFPYEAEQYLQAREESK